MVINLLKLYVETDNYPSLHINYDPATDFIKIFLYFLIFFVFFDNGVRATFMTPALTSCVYFMGYSSPSQNPANLENLDKIVVLTIIESIRNTK